jgi:hypothetical protein
MFRGFKSVCWGIVILVGSVTIAWNAYKLYRHFVPPPKPPPFNPIRNLTITFVDTTPAEAGHRTNPNPVPTRRVNPADWELPLINDCQHSWMEYYRRQETNTWTMLETIAVLTERL